MECFGENRGWFLAVHILRSYRTAIEKLNISKISSKHPAIAQTHVALTGPTRQQVLQLMMTRLESKLAQTHVALTGPTRQQVLQLMMTRSKDNNY